MARTILFDFAQGGGVTITKGTVSLTPTQIHTLGTKVILPGPATAELVDGIASIPNVEPTPVAADGWRYEVKVEDANRNVHYWLVSVPTATTPINFQALPKESAVTLPIGATGVRIEQWMDSVRSHAAAASGNATSALAGLVAVNARIDAMDSGTIDGSLGGVVPGGTDLSAKLTALSALHPGSPIVLGEGLYNFTAPVPLRGGIIGAGNKTILRFVEIGYAALYTEGTNDLHFRDFKLESTSTDTAVTQASSHGILMTGCTNFSINNVFVSGKFVMGIQVAGSGRGTISGNSVTGTTYDGIHITAESNDITIAGNHMINTGDDAIALITYNNDNGPNRRITVIGNTIDGVGHARGITVEGCVDSVVSANVINGTFLHGILVSSISPAPTDIYPTVNCIVTGNIIRNSGSDAICVAGENEGVVIRGNTITDTAFNGVYVISGSVIISDNVIDSPATRGILLTGNVKNSGSVITGNTIRNPGGQGVYNEAADVTINHNVIVRPARIDTVAEGILSAVGDRITAIGNRVTGTSAAKTPNAIWFDGVTGGLVMGNYATGVGNTFGSVNSTGILTT